MFFKPTVVIYLSGHRRRVHMLRCQLVIHDVALPSCLASSSSPSSSSDPSTRKGFSSLMLVCSQASSNWHCHGPSYIVSLNPVLAARDVFCSYTTRRRSHGNPPHERRVSGPPWPPCGRDEEGGPPGNRTQAGPQPLYDENNCPRSRRGTRLVQEGDRCSG